jgi:prepilin peptidase CpaA
MTLFLVAAVLVAAVAAWTDWRTGNIPNGVTLGALFAAPFVHVLVTLLHHGTKADAVVAGSYSVVGAVVCAILPAIFYRLNAIGGGDVKLFIALGAVLRPQMGGEAEIWGFLATGLIAPFLLAYHGKLFKTVTNAMYLAINPFLSKERQREVSPQEMSWFRMGPAILLGTLYVAVEHWRDAAALLAP